MTSAPRVWAPARSAGAALGVAISLLTFACVLVLITTGALASSVPTRVICLVGAILGVAMLVVALVGTWWCSTLRYILDAATLEVRFGSKIARIRYDEIERVGPRTQQSETPPTLWPGAYFGRAVNSSGQTEMWWATTRDPRYAAVVSAAGTSTILTPAEPASIRAELIERARQAPYADTGHAAAARTWLDPVTALDGWARALIFGAVVVASAGVGADGVRYGALQADGVTAAGVLVANGAAAFALSRRWPVVARLVAAGALAGQVVALV